MCISDETASSETIPPVKVLRISGEFDWDYTRNLIGIVSAGGWMMRYEMIAFSQNNGLLAAFTFITRDANC